MPTFSVTLVPPADVTDPSITADVPTSSMALSWTPIVDPNFVAYIIRRTIGSTTIELARLLSIGSNEFTDYTAPLNTIVTYEISTVNTDDVESVGVELDAVLDDTSGYWLVVPEDAEHTFRVQHVAGFEEEEPVQEERHRPLGRDRVLVVQGERTGSEGTLTVKVAPTDLAVVPKIREISDLGAFANVLLKTAFGDVFRVALGSVRRSRLVAGWSQVTFPYVEVGDRESTAGLNIVAPEE
jgi:hypothetical protein